MDINTKPQKVYFPSEPPWKLKNNCVIKDLMAFSKENTPNNVYTSLFNEISSAHINKNWKILYTDGSKTNNSTSFAVINEHLNIDHLALLDQRASIFTAESTAIYYTVNKYKNLRGKFMICSDSKSAVTAIQNIKNKSLTISKIRDILIKFHSKFKIMWIPGHIGIIGNTLADEAAKYAAHAPIIQYPSVNKRDIIKIIAIQLKKMGNDDWNSYQHHYKEFNPNNITPTYPPEATRLDLQKYIRLRLGHTYITNRHLFNNSSPEVCPLCNIDTINIQHLVSNCSTINNAQLTLLGRVCLTDLLKTINIENIHAVQSILKYCNIYHLI